MDNLRFNTKFISFDGIIGRGDYLLNIAYLCIIDVIASLPITWHLLSNMGSASDIFNMGKLYADMPVLLLIWFGIIVIFSLTVRISNIIRRTNDISGKVNHPAGIILSIFLLFATFGMFLPFKIWALFVLINFIICFVLFFKKGAITGKYPKDFLKDFNWGAFFGTWLWGLFNKSFKTLWMFILGLTPAGFWFAIVCGLKGNEWAYRNKKWESDEKFRRSQDIQTIIFVILKLVVLPIIYFLLIFTLIAGFISLILKEEKLNPGQKPPVIEKLGNFVTAYSSLYFESFEITKNENKFYILPSDWAGYSFKDKKDIFDAAATTSAFERMKKEPKKSFSKKTELARTKIYSSKNGELLGEFSINPSAVSKNADFKTVMKAAFEAYKFYRPTVK